MKDFHIYEQPLNKRMRSMMRLELLFEQLAYFTKTRNIWDNTNAINVINDILDFTNRTDIKSEVIKELERPQNLIQSLLDQSSVNEKKALKLLEDIKTLSSQLHTISGTIGQSLKQNNILNAVKQKSILPGSSGNFDSPLYINWIYKSADERNQHLLEWSSVFNPLSEAIKLAMKTIRDSGENTEIVADNGFYQSNLDLSKPYQIIRVAIPKDASYFPEISAGKHRFSIRFMVNNNFYTTPEQVTDDISFTLCNCCF